MRFLNSYFLLLQIIVFLCGAQVATSCLKCFTTPAERSSICHHAVSLGKMGAEECLQRLHWGFDPLNNITMAFNQIKNIRKYLKTFEKEVKKIDKLSWVEQFEIKMADYVNGVKHRVARHPPEECSPPCGLQKAARTFSCSRCAEEDCNIPVSCPLEDIKVEELEDTSILCMANFILPKDLKVIWKYAKIRVTDLSYFEDINIGVDLLKKFHPARFRDKGTYACEILDEDDDIILRRFHYLDVKQTKFGDFEEMQAEFQKALAEKKPAQEEEEERPEQHGPSTKDIILAFLQSRLSHVIYAAVCCLFITLLVGFLWHYALSVDWSKKRTRPSFPPDDHLP